MTALDEQLRIADKKIALWKQSIPVKTPQERIGILEQMLALPETVYDPIIAETHFTTHEPLTAELHYLIGMLYIAQAHHELSTAAPKSEYHHLQALARGFQGPEPHLGLYWLYALQDNMDGVREQFEVLKQYPLDHPLQRVVYNYARREICRMILRRTDKKYAGEAHE